MDFGWQTVFAQVPSKANQYKIITVRGHGSLCKTPALKAFEDIFYMQCGKYKGLMIDHYFEFQARVYYPSMRPDIDNSLKCLLDCLQYTKTIKNDNLCTKVTAEKFVDKICPRVEFKIITIDNNDTYEL